MDKLEMFLILIIVEEVVFITTNVNLKLNVEETIIIIIEEMVETETEMPQVLAVRMNRRIIMAAMEVDCSNMEYWSLSSQANIEGYYSTWYKECSAPFTSSIPY